MGADRTAGMSVDLVIPDLDPDVDTSTAALAYADAGWYVGPLARGTKNPGSVLGRGWQTLTSRDPQTIISWFAGCAAGTGIFLHVGRSGAWVADVDHPEHLPDVLRAACASAPYQSTRPDTPDRGHYSFAVPPGRRLGNSRGSLGKAWGEARGANGVIVVAPTPHPEGGRYRWERTGPVPVLPAAVAAELPDITSASGAASDERVNAFLAAHRIAVRPELLEVVLRAFDSEVAAGGGRHDAAVSATCWAMREAAAGQYNAADAARQLRDRFVSAMADAGPGRTLTADQAGAEYAGILAWAVGQAEAEDAEALRKRIDRRLEDDPDALIGKSATPTPAETPKPCTLDQAHGVFRRWLGASYDFDSLDALLCALAAERLGGDPLWLLIVSGPGNAKTETVQAAVGAGALVTSTISSEGALLSGSPKKDKAKDATGGLLRKIGPSGVLVIKDVTSILSMGRELRAAVLAALREVHDGYWARNLGVDGGRTLTWEGRIVVIGAVTTAWDRAHDVVAAMGDRFVLVRTDSSVHRITAGRRAIGNTGDEEAMRGDLADAVGGVLAGMDASDHKLTDAEIDRLLGAADLVTLARTGVDIDYRGDVVDSHAPEMPTRFAKQLAQVVRGGVALGMDRRRALRLALRCARDSMPPLRLAIVDDVAAHPGTFTPDVRRRLNKPRATVDRQLQALHMLGVLTCDEQEHPRGVRWSYRLGEGIDPAALAVPEMSPPRHWDTEKREGKLGDPTDISGTASPCHICHGPPHEPSTHAYRPEVAA
jgi:hypothetical protein